MSERDDGSFSELIADYKGASNEPIRELLPRTLRAIRMHLGMDVAFVSEFADGRRYFRYVDSSIPNQHIQPGQSDPLEDSYCQRVVDGRLPEVIPDTEDIAATEEIPATKLLPVGAHLSVPIMLKSGRTFGTLCCFSFTRNQTLNERDLGVMRVFAELAADQIDRDLAIAEATNEQIEVESRIRSVLSGDAVSMVYQPIYHLATNKVVGFESLARFSSPSNRTPDMWFADANRVGLAIPLQIKVVKLALLAISQLPNDVFVSVNLSPEVILQGNIVEVLRDFPLEQVILEVTEHAVIHHYGELARLIAPLRANGLRIAVDDAGAGYASFRHILNLAPDIIKLDISITRNIDSDYSRRALAAALIGFATSTNSKIVAEGVETAAELAVLRQLGVNKVQGFFLGKPMPLVGAASMIGGAKEFV